MMRYPAQAISLWLLVCCLAACSRSASREEAEQWLPAAGKWKLREVTVNGKPVYRDGEIIEQFGEVAFSRYMEEVSFLPNGDFTGNFKNDPKPVTFKWTATDSEVTISDTVPGSGSWSIPYARLQENAFEMNTETTAYDPPNLTKIRLRFER
ncbi:MAG: hypothetical protein ABS46_16335 [Cytophagaceae bacterium SCN 52-12]|nr:MAG: hypothetical protein ABS46_16335 [Cytophagaceae bacterium SCN 52-12]